MWLEIVGLALWLTPVVGYYIVMPMAALLKRGVLC
jgi:hypothetical protein